MKSIKYIAAAAVIAAAAAIAWLTWSAIGELTPTIAWSELEAPARVAAGEMIEIAVRYRSIDPPARLNVDLHWQRRDGKPMGFLTRCGQPPEVAGDGEQRFRLEVVPREGMGHVRVVVYLGATDSWIYRDRAAVSEPIPVMAAGTDMRGIRRVTHALYAESDGGDGTAGGARLRAGRDTPAIAALYLTAAVLCGWCATRYRRLGREQDDAAGRRAERMWCAVAAVLIVTGAFALVDLGGFLAELGRIAAREMGYYLERRPFQKAAITAIAAAAVLVAGLLLIRLRRATPSLWIASLGAVLLLGFAAVRSFSFHGFDALGRPFCFQFSIAWLAEAAVVIIVAFAAFVAIRFSAGR